VRGSIFLSSPACMMQVSALRILRRAARNCLCETLHSLPADCSSHHRRITSLPSATTSAADVTKHLFSTGGSCAAKGDEAALRASCRSNPLLISLSRL
jgi:hypothetical protein